MALIQCKECGSQVSDKATVCPQCGNPLKNSPRCKKSLWYILGIFAIAAIIGSCLLFLNGRNDFPGAASDIVNITPEFSKKIRNYKQVSDFSEGYAAVMRDDKWGYIDMNGDEVISCRYDYAYPFIEGIARVVIDDKDRYINIKAEEVKDGEYRYNKKAVVESDSPYILFKTEEGKYGYKDEDGHIIVPAKYTSLNKFSAGVAVAQIRTTEYDPNNIEGLEYYGYVDTKGNTTLNEEYFAIVEKRDEIARANARTERQKQKEESTNTSGESRTFYVSMSYTYWDGQNSPIAHSSDGLYYKTNGWSDYWIFTRTLTVPDGKVWIFKSISPKTNVYNNNHYSKQKPEPFIGKTIGTSDNLDHPNAVYYDGFQFRKYGGESFVLGMYIHNADNKFVEESCAWEIIEKDEI